MKRHMKCIVFLSLTALLMQSMSIVSLAARHLPENAGWNNLRQLAPGAEIKIVLRNKKSYRGKFQSLNDEGIMVRFDRGEQTFDRQNVLRVSVEGQSHRLRHILLGALIGAGSGAIVGAGADAENVFHFSGPHQGLAIFLPSSAFVGAVVGTVLPARKWRVLYRAP